MNNSDIETWVTLKFCPPESSKEYIDSLPEKARLRYMTRYTRSTEEEITLENFTLVYGFLFQTSMLDSMWEELKPHLVEYYSEKVVDKL